MGGYETGGRVVGNAARVPENPSKRGRFQTRKPPGFYLGLGRV